MSHKRSSSAAGNTTTEPEPKKHQNSQAGSIAALQEVFAVIEEIRPFSGIINRTTLGLYATAKDANNEVYKLRQQYLDEGRIPHKTAEKRRYLYSGGVDSRGYAWWAFGPDHQAVPFVHGVRVAVTDWVVEAPKNSIAEAWEELQEWVELDWEDEDDGQEEVHAEKQHDDYDDEEDNYSDGANDRPWH